VGIDTSTQKLLLGVDASRRVGWAKYFESERGASRSLGFLAGLVAEAVRDGATPRDLTRLVDETARAASTNHVEFTAGRWDAVVAKVDVKPGVGLIRSSVRESAAESARGQLVAEGRIRPRRVNLQRDAQPKRETKPKREKPSGTLSAIVAAGKVRCAHGACRRLLGVVDEHLLVIKCRGCDGLNALHIPTPAPTPPGDV
jgi:phage FluMu protein Com